MDINAIMEQASADLAAMRYLVAEGLCLQALAEARRQQQWATYARILLPLQECRRQRRMMAADGLVRLGTSGLGADLVAAWGNRGPGCVLVTEPHHQADALHLLQHAQSKQWHLEVLWAEPSDGDSWTLRSFAGPAVTCVVPAPPSVWRHRWLDAATLPLVGKRPSDWFIDAGELLGDAAMRQVTAPVGTPQCVDELEQRLAVVADHELLHQRLAIAARALSLRL